MVREKVKRTVSCSKRSCKILVQIFFWVFVVMDTFQSEPEKCWGSTSSPVWNQEQCPSDSSNCVFPLVSLQATGVREDQLLVTILPGLPTAAEFFLLPDKQLNEGKPDKNAAHLDQVRRQLLLNLCKYIQNLCRWMLFTFLSWNHAKDLSVASFFLLYESYLFLSSNCSVKTNPTFQFPHLPADVTIDLLKCVQVIPSV